MESGEERRRQQVDLQLQSDLQLEESNRLAARVATAKSLLRLAVDRKNVYSDYLESVVTSVGGQYKDVISLMERCQALVIARSLLFVQFMVEHLFQGQTKRSSSNIEREN